MISLWRFFGSTIYVVGWPVFYLILNKSQRTRVLVRNQGRLLFVKDWIGDGSWKLPGGGIHHNEAPIQSAQRELLEETGIHAKTENLKSLGTVETKKRNVTSLIHVFELDLPAQAEIQKHIFEIIDTAWLTVDEISTAKISSSTRTILAKFN